MSELEHQREQLLAEEITDAELREILERLGQDEFGGSGQSRVADIVELTGIPPEAICRILADIRKDEWEKRFGLRQDRMEARVDHHEKVLKDHAEELRKARQAEQRPEPKPKAYEVQIPSRRRAESEEPEPKRKPKSKSKPSNHRRNGRTCRRCRSIITISTSSPRCPIASRSRARMRKSTTRTVVSTSGEAVFFLF